MLNLYVYIRRKLVFTMGGKPSSKILICKGSPFVFYSYSPETLAKENQALSSFRFLTSVFIII